MARRVSKEVPAAGYGVDGGLSAALTATDRDDLGFAVPGRHCVAYLFPEQCARQRRSMRQRSLRGIGLVFTDNAKRLFTAIIADDRNRAAKPDLRRIGDVRYDASRRTPGTPITQLAGRLSHRGAIIRRLRDAMRSLRCRNRRFNLRKTFRGHIVRMLGDRPVRQILNRVGFLYEGSAHRIDMGSSVQPRKGNDGFVLMALSRFPTI